MRLLGGCVAVWVLERLLAHAPALLWPFLRLLLLPLVLVSYKPCLALLLCLFTYPLLTAAHARFLARMPQRRHALDYLLAFCTRGHRRTVSSLVVFLWSYIVLSLLEKGCREAPPALLPALWVLLRAGAYGLLIVACALAYAAYSSFHNLDVHTVERVPPLSMEGVLVRMASPHGQGWAAWAASLLAIAATIYQVTTACAALATSIGGILLDSAGLDSVTVQSSAVPPWLSLLRLSLSFVYTTLRAFIPLMLLGLATFLCIHDMVTGTVVPEDVPMDVLLR